jgi:hypothetical protein
MGTVIAGPWGAGDPPITHAPPPLDIQQRRTERWWAIVIGSLLLMAASGATAVVLTADSGHHSGVSAAVSQTQYQAEARKIDLDMMALQAAMDDAAQNNNYSAAFVFMDTLATDLGGFDTRVAAMPFPAAVRTDVHAMLADDIALRSDITKRSTVSDAAGSAWLQNLTADFTKAGDAHALVRTDLGLPRNAPEPTQTPVWL